MTPQRRFTNPCRFSCLDLGVKKVSGSELFPLATVEVEVPETGVVQTLVAGDGAFHGTFTPPSQQPNPQPLRIRIKPTSGAEVAFSHRYRLRLPGEGVVQKIESQGADNISFFAVAVAPDGTVWGGGDPNGVLYRVTPGSSTAILVRSLLTDPAGRVEDLAFDQLGRLHAIAFAPLQSGDFVINVDADPDLSPCQTVNVFDPTYPFRF
jgi:hypothetical protein